MTDKKDAALIIKNAEKDFAAGVISRRDFNLIMMSYGAIAGYVLFSSYAAAWTGARMRKSSGVSGYQILRSLRFRASVSAYLTRTLTNNTNRTKWTYSAWIKRGSLNTTAPFLTGVVSAGSTEEWIGFNGDALTHHDGSTGALVVTSSLFRDPSAWYHIFYVYDSTQGTAANRGIFYVNGVVQSTTTNAIGLNRLSYINSSVAHAQGRFASIVSNPFDGLISEVYFTDGLALTTASFGEINSTTGVWCAKKYSGSYGTNGFYLNFSDPTTTTTLCYDRSGNGNNWTPNNLSVTAGATYDSLIDVPMIGQGNERGNYCTLNPLFFDTPLTLSAANLNSTTNLLANWSGVSGTICVSSGQWYWETTAVSAVNPGSEDLTVGIQLVNSPMPTSAGGYAVGSYAYITSGSKINNSTTTGYAATWTNGDVIGIALDLNAGTLTFYKNGVSQGVAFSGLSGTFTPAVHHSSYPVAATNFGQRPFSYTAPTSHKALHTGNLPTPAIVKSSQYFDIASRTGTGAAFSVTGKALQPDLVWSKSRNNAYSNLLADSVRGVSKWSQSDTVSAEASDAQMITSFNSDGFSGGTATALNGAASTMVDWMWKKGVTPGFDIVAFTGDGVLGKTVAHSLGVAPAFIITKLRTNGSANWVVYHQNMAASPATGALNLNLTTVFSTSTDPWNNTAPSASVITLGAGVGSAWTTNLNTQTVIAYLWAEVSGFSKFGNYTGNASVDGPFIYCGFRPRYLLIKSTTAATDWYVHDTARDSSNYTIKCLYPNLSVVENSTELESTYGIDFLANGFKIRSSHSTRNSSGANYIYAAFAEMPFKYANAR